MKDMLVKLVFSGDATRMDAALKQSERRLKSFGGVARREFDSIRSAAHSVQGKLAALGLSFGALMLIKQSAELDKGLTRIGQTAGESHVAVTGLRKEFFRMSKATGQSIENLKAGFDNAVQAGLNFKAALAVTDAVNKGMAVTGASAAQLTSGLTVAATAFQFDLSQPGQALALLDKMTVAGRQGSAELEDIAAIFARVGVNASRAGMGFDQVLGFIEGLSMIEQSPERLATLGDSTLRLFTNVRLLRRAQSVTGVRFFDKAGARRDTLEVLEDLKTKYDAFKTDAQREAFMGSAFQGADRNTIKGLQLLMAGDILAKIKVMNREIADAGGTLEKDMKAGLNNAIDQSARLKNTLREAADAFIQPFNDGISAGIKKLLDAKKDGGLEMSGKELAGYGAAALGVSYLGYRLGGPALKKLLGRLGQTGVGITEGKAIEAATGVTPVFVVNMPAGGMGMLPGTPSGMKGGEGLIWLKRLTPLLATAGATVMAVGGAVISSATAANALLDVARGGSGKNWISDAWERQVNAIDRDIITPIASMFTTDGPAIKNEINIGLRVDETRRLITDIDRLNNTEVRVDLDRGSFGY